ncbi:MAG: haloacid dehalogenase-like hydrolase [Actinomycetota bacterium]
MTLPASDAQYDATPEQALAAIDGHTGPVIVDLDETLLLANSTSLFLDSVRPAFLAYLVVKLVDVLRRVRKSSSGPDQDTRRVRGVLTLLPWSGWWWRRRVDRVIPELVNRPLVDRLNQAGGPVIVSTKGYRPVVEPVVAAAGLRQATLVAMDPRSAEDRDEAKYRLTTDALAPTPMAESLVVTDSLADGRLLEASGTPLRVIWPLRRVPGLFSRVYFPGRYLGVKRPRAQYVRKIAMEDLALWILGSIWLADQPITHLIGLVVLGVSFWAVYELGYLDNDRVAERHEADPALSDMYYQRAVLFETWKPAVAAILTGVAGLWILRWPDGPDPFDYVRWAAVLVTTTVVFRLYNRVDKQTRVLLYPLLQLARLGAFLAVVPTTATADMAIIVVTLLRWVSYYMYRTRDGHWPTDDLTVIRFIVFAAGSALLAAQHEWSDLVAPTTISLLVWAAFLARRSLPKALAQAHRIDRPTGPGGPSDDHAGTSTRTNGSKAS